MNANSDLHESDDERCSRNGKWAVCCPVVGVKDGEAADADAFSSLL